MIDEDFEVDETLANECFQAQLSTLFLEELKKRFIDTVATSLKYSDISSEDIELCFIRFKAKIQHIPRAQLADLEIPEKYLPLLQFLTIQIQCETPKLKYKSKQRQRFPDFDENDTFVEEGNFEKYLRFFVYYS